MKDLLRNAVSVPVGAITEANTADKNREVDQSERAKAAQSLRANPRLQSLFVDDKDPDYDYVSTCHVTVSHGDSASIADSIASTFR